jgi:hypothetical protein
LAIHDPLQRLEEQHRACFAFEPRVVVARVARDQCLDALGAEERIALRLRDEVRYFF